MVDILVRKPVTLQSLKGLNLDDATLRRVTFGVVAAVKESFGDEEIISKREAEQRTNVAVRFVLRCVGDGNMSVQRAMTFLKSALPVELAGMEYPIPTGSVYRVPE